MSVSDSLHAAAALWGGRGQDRLSGGGHLFGGPGGDRLRAATDRGVRLSGGAGPDYIIGGQGADDIAGGGGDDLIVPGRGGDVVEAGAGNDRLVASKNGRDHVSCGSGADIARLDGLDLLDPLKGRPTCEQVLRSTPARALPAEIYEVDLADTIWIDVQCPWDLPLGCITKTTLSIPRGRTLGSRRLFIPAGATRSPEFYPQTERPVALLEERGAKATVSTYSPNSKPRKAVTVFPFSVYTGEG